MVDIIWALFPMLVFWCWVVDGDNKGISDVLNFTDRFYSFSHPKSMSSHIVLDYTMVFVVIFSYFRPFT